MPNHDGKRLTLLCSQTKSILSRTAGVLVSKLKFFSNISLANEQKEDFLARWKHHDVAVDNSFGLLIAHSMLAFVDLVSRI